jgi:hypothetical protein
MHPHDKILLCRGAQVIERSKLKGARRTGRKSRVSFNRQGVAGNRGIDSQIGGGLKRRPTSCCVCQGDGARAQAPGHLAVRS